jgi:glutathione peroxidase
VSFPLGASWSQRAAAPFAVPPAGGRGRRVPGDITWNFEKFLVGKDGRVLARFSAHGADDPAVVQAIEKALV